MIRILLGLLLFSAGLYLGRHFTSGNPNAPLDRLSVIEESTRSPASTESDQGNSFVENDAEDEDEDVVPEIPLTKARLVMAQIPSYLLREEAEERRFQSLRQLTRLFPKKIGNIENEQTVWAWRSHLKEKYLKAFSRGRTMTGEFRYDVDGEMVNATVVMELGPSSEGGHFICQSIRLILQTGRDGWYNLLGTCQVTELHLFQNSGLLIDFDLERGSSENLGRRLLVEVPFVAGGNAAVLIDSRPSSRTFSVSWRYLSKAEGEAVLHDFSRKTGVMYISSGSSSPGDDDVSE
ncbi:MAG: hypothetical protein KF789_07840 [Bdellovibrionaceae bacterium]|nr:hypothetical protein [Pseudobdellovibrionaceae bacterium]